MGYITEPKGVDFLVAPTIFTEDDTIAIRAAIVNYRQVEPTTNHRPISRRSAGNHDKTSNRKHKKLA